MPQAANKMCARGTHALIFVLYHTVGKHRESIESVSVKRSTHERQSRTDDAFPSSRAREHPFCRSTRDSITKLPCVAHTKEDIVRRLPMDRSTNEHRQQRVHKYRTPSDSVPYKS